MHLFAPRWNEAHPLTRVDARVKLLSALALLVMVISCRSGYFPLLVAAVCLALSLMLGARPKQLALRFAEPLFIAVTILLLKTFFSGKLPLFSLSFAGFDLVAHRDGLLDGLFLASRIAGAVSVVAVVGFATQFTELMAALAWLRIPQSLVDVALFAWRYLFVLFEDALVVYAAQRNRMGYVGYRRALRSMGSLAGVLVIKAFDNSQSITTAMVQRGYDGRMPLLRHKPFVAAEVLSSLLFLAVMAAARSL